MPVLTIKDFSGGINLRDSPEEIAPNESPDVYNMTLDQRGAIIVRKGSTLRVVLPGTVGKRAFIFYSSAINQWLCARESGATLHLFTRPGDLATGAWTDRGTINSVVSAIPAFADFPGVTPKVVVTSNVNSGATKGIFTWDGAALVNVSTVLSGSTLALYQNRMWLAGYPVNDANGTIASFFACAPADPATWTTAGGGLSNQVRDLDAFALTCLCVAGNAMLLFKRRSAYRLIDSTTAEYQIVDQAAGCVGSKAFALLRGKVYTFGDDGIYEWDGVGPGRNRGDKVRPTFFTDNVKNTPGDFFAGGVNEDRVVFTYPQVNVNAPEDMYELDPAHGWITRLTTADSKQIYSFANRGTALYWAAESEWLASAFDDSLGRGRDGTGAALIFPHWTTPWLKLGQGHRARVHRVDATGAVYGADGFGGIGMRLAIQRDYNRGSTVFVSMTPRGAGENGIVVDNNYDSGLYTGRSFGQGVAFQFEFMPADGQRLGTIRSFAIDYDVIDA